MNWEQMLQMLLPILGQTGVHELADKLKALSMNADEEWKQTILTILADAVKKNGPAGVTLAMQAINDALEGRPVKIDWTDLTTASNIVAHLQNAEADRKSAVNDYIAKVGEVAGIILAALLKGLLTR